MKLPQELARDSFALLAILPQIGYWHARANWGLTERDIAHATITAASFGVFALAAAVHPERSPCPMYGAALFPLGRLTEWMHGERWFLVLRLTLIGVTLALIGSIILSAPELLSQDQFRAGQFFDQEVRIRAMEISNERLNARLDNLTAQVSEIKENIIWARNAMFTLLGGVAIFLIKEFLMLLKSVLPKVGRELDE